MQVQPLLHTIRKVRPAVPEPGLSSAAALSAQGLQRGVLSGGARHFVFTKPFETNGQMPRTNSVARPAPPPAPLHSRKGLRPRPASSRCRGAGYVRPRCHLLPMASGRLPPRRVAPLQRHRTGDAHACFPAGPHQRDVSEKWLRRGRRQARVSCGAAWPRAVRLTPSASGRAWAMSGWPRPAPGSCRASPAPVGTFRDLGLCPDVAPPRPLFSVCLASS